MSEPCPCGGTGDHEGQPITDCDECNGAYDRAIRTAAFLMVAAEPHPLDFSCPCIAEMTADSIHTCWPTPLAFTN
jgi:hypothetical protein